MDTEEKIKILLNSKGKVILELGCGNRKRSENWIGIDQYSFDCVDLVGKVKEVLSLFPDNSVDEVYSFHYLEHENDFKAVIEQLCRIVKNGGKVNTVVPHFRNPYYYSDYTHKNFFGLYSFCYLTNKYKYLRKVPIYGRALPFEVTKIKLIFKSPFYLIYPFKKVIELIVNSHSLIQEFYEEILGSHIACYEIDYKLTITKE